MFLSLCWDTVDMSISLPFDKCLEIQQLANALLQRHSIRVHHIMFFLGKTTFYASGNV